MKGFSRAERDTLNALMERLQVNARCDRTPAPLRRGCTQARSALRLSPSIRQAVSALFFQLAVPKANGIACIARCTARFDTAEVARDEVRGAGTGLFDRQLGRHCRGTRHRFSWGLWRACSRHSLRRNNRLVPRFGALPVSSDPICAGLLGGLFLRGQANNGLTGLFGPLGLALHEIFEMRLLFGAERCSHRGCRFHRFNIRWNRMLDHRYVRQGCGGRIVAGFGGSEWRKKPKAHHDSHHQHGEQIAPSPRFGGRCVSFRRWRGERLQRSKRIAACCAFRRAARVNGLANSAPQRAIAVGVGGGVVG